MEDRNSFVSQVPFVRYRQYNLWFRLTIVLLILLFLILGAITWYNYIAYQDLLVQKNALIGNIGQLDEMVRKKNKLLSRDEKGEMDGKYQGGHAKIAKFLIEIESALAPGVYLNSFEYTINKIELVGYSDCVENLSQTVFNLKKLSFVKDHDIEQVTKNTKAANHKLAFTIIINL